MKYSMLKILGLVGMIVMVDSFNSADICPELHRFIARAVKGDVPLIQALRDTNNIHDRIRIVREKRRLTVLELAEMMGVDAKTVDSWEFKGEYSQIPQPFRIPILAQVLNVDPWLLVTGKFKDEALKSLPTQGRRIDTARYVNGLTQEKLAEEVEVTLTTVNRWVNDNVDEISEHNVIKLVKVLDVDSWLLIKGKSKLEVLREIDTMGERIILCRYMMGLTEGDLAKILHKRIDTINDWELNINRPHTHSISILASTLDIDAWILVTGKFKDEALRATAHIGERIRLARYIKGLTRKELAPKINISPSTLRNWEENPSPPLTDETIALLSLYLEIEQDFLKPS
jgi:transcriptional regulator with XRE-family HTH domain